MALAWLLRFTFVLYCTTVGILLLLAPWTAGWEVVVLHLPFPGSRILADPLVRGGLSGFGLVHLVWGAHDLNLLLRTDGGAPRP